MDSRNTLWETAMPAEPPGFAQWIRRDLKDRYAAILSEPVPNELIALLDRA